AQLGLKVQHALRAFTAKDRKEIRMAAQNYPLTDYYNIEKEITALGTGEALITALNEDGRPTPLVRTLLRAPESRMDILTQQEITEIINHSALIPKYNKTIEQENTTKLLKRNMDRTQSKYTQT